MSVNDSGGHSTKGNTQLPTMPQPAPTSGVLSEEQRAALDLDVSWLFYRTEFRKRMVQEGYLKHYWRSVFEADMIFSLIAQRHLEGSPITLKELATYFKVLATEVTVKRHIDDMEGAGTVMRITDSRDRRRLFLVPTVRLAEIGRIFLQARVDLALDQGFVYDPERAATIKKARSAG
ncbi:MAG TPA: MarR family transcriptional regulator [Devosia sp.]|uniref:MarR family transcriptional regulator n=1 Tax=Devosia sp. TaxID=1871048 RepID=UPI002F94AE3E